MARGQARGPGGSRRPGQPRAARPNPRPRAVPAAPQVAATTGGRLRPRLTGRALVLLVVLAVLTVSYASSMRAYLQQRSHISTLKAQIAEREASIDDLEREKQRWHDDAFVRAQARERLSYVMPGETSYVVLGEDGKPIDSRASLHNAKQLFKKVPEAWWNGVWSSVELAGNPPKTQQPPATMLGR